jgi:hypothetical protein
MIDKEREVINKSLPKMRIKKDENTYWKSWSWRYS